MSEEEKKAIKGLEWSQKQMRLGNLPDYDQGHYADIRVVLNLIEKQQKEIENIEEYVNSPEFLDWHLGFTLLDELEYRKNNINELLEEK